MRKKQLNELGGRGDNEAYKGKEKGRKKTRRRRCPKRHELEFWTGQLGAASSCQKGGQATQREVFQKGRRDGGCAKDGGPGPRQSYTAAEVREGAAENEESSPRGQEGALCASCSSLNGGFCMQLQPGPMRSEVRKTARDGERERGG